jgi:hypothetical protein
MLLETLPLSLSAQTAYAQLLDATVAADLARSVADLPGAFASREVKGHRYWYFQYTEPAGKLRQVYVGPDTEPVRALVARKAGPAGRDALGPLAASATALGCTAVLPRHFRVLARLADYGFFRAGGVLVGTHAFLAIGNQLGVRWSLDARTHDLDFAHAGRSVALALPTSIDVRTDAAIESLGMGFLPLRGLSGSGGATWLVPNEPDFRLDFLTPRHRGGDRPFRHPALHVELQPLRFMEYVLEDVRQATLPGTSGAVLVNVPAPGRFALHKLVVAAERSGAWRTKANKDVAQAAYVIDWLQREDRAELDRAWADLNARGAGWKTRLQRGLAMLDRAYPAVLRAAPSADR